MNLWSSGAVGGGGVEVARVVITITFFVRQPHALLLMMYLFVCDIKCCNDSICHIRGMNHLGFCQGSEL